MEYGIRQEYLDAVRAAQTGFWLVPVFAVSPLLLIWAYFRRWNLLPLGFTFLVCVILTWACLFCYIENVWQTMQSHAQTDAELGELADDTGRVLGPFIVGVPFAVIYSSISWASVALSFWLVRLVLPNNRTDGQSMPTP